MYEGLKSNMESMASMSSVKFVIVFAYLAMFSLSLYVSCRCPRFTLGYM
jgi:hypothetical protein